MQSRIYDRLLSLVQHPSITSTKGEKSIAKYIHESFRDSIYFQENPEHLMLHPIEEYDLFSVLALLKASTPTTTTVLLISHFDVVDVDEYGYLKEYAFSPEVYTEKLKTYSLPQEAKADLETGEWLFGRGIMDMKCGLAIHMELMKYYMEHRDILPCNLLLVTVPDEEGNSKGILGTAPKLLELSEKHNLHYHLAINTEPFFPLYAGDKKRYLYTGSIGKLLPMFYCVGKETHVGEPYSGLNPNLLLSEIHRRIEANPEFCEKWGDFVTPPPTCLKQRDLKDSYSVQIPRTAVSYYNWMVLRETPQTLLEKLKDVVKEAVNVVLEERQQRLEDFIKLSSYPLESPYWNIGIKTFEEVYQVVIEAHGASFRKHIQEKIVQWKSLGIKDERDLTIKIVDETYAYYPNNDPLVILLYAPPYYPSLWNEGTTPHEIFALNLVEDLIQFGKSNYSIDLDICPFFPGLSDASYFGVKDGRQISEGLKPNMPLWGDSYRLPTETLEGLTLPVINIGVHGKDAHKYTERLHLPFSLEITPKMIMYCIERLGK